MRVYSNVVNSDYSNNWHLAGGIKSSLGFWCEAAFELLDKYFNSVWFAELCLPSWREASLNNVLSIGDLQMLKSLTNEGNDSWQGMLKVAFCVLELGPMVEVLGIGG